MLQIFLVLLDFFRTRGQCAATCDGPQTQCANGACVNLSRDAANCGSCGNVCKAANMDTEVTCQTGQCQIASCLNGTHNCDGVFSTGCNCPSAMRCVGTSCM